MKAAHIRKRGYSQLDAIHNDREIMIPYARLMQALLDGLAHREISRFMAE